MVSRRDLTKLFFFFKKTCGLDLNLYFKCISFFVAVVGYLYPLLVCNISSYQGPKWCMQCLTLKSLVVAKVNDKHTEPQNALQYTDTSLKHFNQSLWIYLHYFCHGRILANCLWWDNTRLLGFKYKQPKNVQVNKTITVSLIQIKRKQIYNHTHKHSQTFSYFCPNVP